MNLDQAEILTVLADGGLGPDRIREAVLDMRKKSDRQAVPPSPFDVMRALSVLWRERLITSSAGDAGAVVYALTDAGRARLPNAASAS